MHSNLFTRKISHRIIQRRSRLLSNVSFDKYSTKSLPCTIRAPITRSFSSQPTTSQSGTAIPKMTIEKLNKLYTQKIPITMMTAHDYPSGMFCEKSGMDMVLVGDSLAMVALGYDSTNPITIEDMMHHSRAVARACKSCFLVGDMPFGTYEFSTEHAVKNAIRFLKEGRMEAVKLEGGVEMAPTIKRITSVGVPVLGHIGLTPQRASSLSGFKAQGRTVEKAKLLIEDAIALQEAGAFAIVLEAIPELVATHITKILKIPTIGIGSGAQCNGQVLVQLDILGVYDKLAPKFAKIYATIGQESIEALRTYKNEVKGGTFPASGVHTYKMLAGQEELFLEYIKAINS